MIAESLGIFAVVFGVAAVALSITMRIPFSDAGSVCASLGLISASAYSFVQVRQGLGAFVPLGGRVGKWLSPLVGFGVLLELLGMLYKSPWRGVAVSCTFLGLSLMMLSLPSTPNSSWKVR
ncbi:MAG: hypothetical protein JOZ59_01965 [Candidatus Eremiobacteraeota bacterium]|nr:hypothetical protein [Candidatus Eremiobacteraeota bacterium]